MNIVICPGMCCSSTLVQWIHIQWKPVIRTSSGVEKNVLITGTLSMGKDRNRSHTMVLITDMFL